MKAVFIVGPTATGKTDLALRLIPFLLRLPGVTGIDLLSADSKQVYRGQNVVTGKDLSKLEVASRRYGDQLGIFGLDVVRPDGEWSVAHFLRYVRPIISEAEKRRRLVVVVGGTGQYLTALVRPPATAVVPRNEALRRELNYLSVAQLADQLKSLNPSRYSQMNTSDRLNPRRLVRAVETSLSGKSTEDGTDQSTSLWALWLGLNLAPVPLQKRIQARVQARLKAGAEAEAKSLARRYPHWRPEAQSAIGYPEIARRLKGELSETELPKLWELHERQYAKRQMVWFKKQPVHWFAADLPNLLEIVEAQIQAWYTEEKL